MSSSHRGRGSDLDRASGLGSWVKWVLLSAIPILLAYLQGPAVLDDLHKRMCGSSWKAYAGWAGDCTTNAQERSAAVAARAPEVTDPLEILTRRGYSLDQPSLLRAISLGRREDIELFARAGYKIETATITRIHVPKGVWDGLVVKQLIFDLPCNMSILPANEGWWTAPNSLLDGAAQHKNVEIIKGLCGGQYIAGVRAALKKIEPEIIKAREGYAKAQAQVRSGNAEAVTSFAKALPLCVASVDAAMPESLMKEFTNCEMIRDRMNRNNPAYEATRDAACAKPRSVHLALQEVERKMIALGFSNPSNANCADGAFGCINLVGNTLAYIYHDRVVRPRTPDFEEYQRRRRDEIGKACQKFRPDAKPEVKQLWNPLHEFYDKFVRVIGPL